MKLIVLVFAAVLLAPVVLLMCAVWPVLEPLLQARAAAQLEN